KDARNSRGMLGKPLLHLRDRPLPFKRMGVEAIVFGPSHRDVAPELLPAWPRPSVQIMAAEGTEIGVGSFFQKTNRHQFSFSLEEVRIWSTNPPDTSSP